MTDVFPFTVRNGLKKQRKRQTKTPDRVKIDRILK